VRQYITAGDANETVPAISIFKKVLIRGLDGDADINRDGYITGTELGEFLPQGMARYTTAQNPQYGKIRDPRLDEGDFVFRAPSSGQGEVATTVRPEPDQPPTAPVTLPLRPAPTTAVLPRAAEPPSAPPTTEQRQIAIRTPQPPSEAELQSVTAESIVNRNLAAVLAREKLPEGAIERRTQCKTIEVVGSSRFRCTVWYVVGAPAGTAPTP
jgi:hypothetical protein